MNMIANNNQDKNNPQKTMKTEMGVGGERIRHESLMNEMHAEYDDDDLDNIELLKTMIGDNGPDDDMNMNDNDSNQSIQKVIRGMDDELLLKYDDGHKEE